MMNTPIIFNPEIPLTEHFKLGEFTKSITAERLGICKGCYWEVYGRAPARAVHPEKSGSGRPHDPFLV